MIFLSLATIIKIPLQNPELLAADEEERNVGAPTEPEIVRLSVQEVKERLDEGEQLYFVDVRRHPDESKIQGATYYDPEAILASPRVEFPVSKDCLVITY